VEYIVFTLSSLEDLTLAEGTGGINQFLIGVLAWTLQGWLVDYREVQQFSVSHRTITFD